MRRRRRTVSAKLSFALFLAALLYLAACTPGLAQPGHRSSDDSPLSIPQLLPEANNTSGRSSLRPMPLERSIAAASPAESGAAGSVLILYDTAGEYGWVGQIHARMLANLLGHFPVTYKAHPVEDYRRGMLRRFDAAFYIGSTYDNVLPPNFVRDVMTGDTPLCWFKYNIWRLAWTQTGFSSKFGFTFNWLDWTGYDTIHYRGETYAKYQADPELGYVWLLYPSTCEEIATASRTVDGTTESIPYIVKGGNLWYVADLPFSYVSEEDRYLIFCDLLYDILGYTPPETKRALCRIEDVNPISDPDELRAIADYLYSRDVPFAVGVVPVYTDPLGFYSEGVPEYTELSWNPDLVSALHYMESKGGQIVLHGYTHQYDSTPNPYNGVTGDDFEFYRCELAEDWSTIYSGAVPEDSSKWAKNRVKAGLAELQAAGFTPVAWETPHYAASSEDYLVFASMFDLTTQRAIYFDLRLPAHGFKGDGPPTYFGGQYFPYVIQQDIYGQKIAPENLGSYEPDPWPGYRYWYVEDVLRCAEKNAVLRDAWASFYFHPFYEIESLEEIVEGLQSMGYTFAPLRQDME